MEQTVSVLLNHPDNDPYNKPTVIKVMLIPESSADKFMEIDHRYALEVDGVREYKTKTLKIDRADFPLPTEENDSDMVFSKHHSRDGMNVWPH